MRARPLAKKEKPRRVRAGLSPNGDRRVEEAHPRHDNGQRRALFLRARPSPAALQDIASPTAARSAAAVRRYRYRPWASPAAFSVGAIWLSGAEDGRCGSML